LTAALDLACRIHD